MKRKTLYILMLVYGGIIAIMATLIYGVRLDLYIGLIFGIGSLILNHWLLIYVIEGIIKNQITFSTIPIGLSRFLIFGAAGWFCFKRSHLCVVMFAAGILAMPVAALIGSIWEVKHD